MNNGDIESRKIKQKTQTGKETWVTEIGEENLSSLSNNEFLIRESSTNKNVSYVIQ